MEIDNRYSTDDRLPIFLGYDQIAERIEEMVDEINSHHYDAIVILLRGGSFPGMHLSFITGIPVYFLHYNRSNQKVSWKGDMPKKDNKVLLVEDFAGRGTTLTDCIDFLSADYIVHTFVVCKDSLSRLQNPHYCCFELNANLNERYIIPWERLEYQIANNLLKS